MGITANRLRGLGLVDEVIAEPLGGAHRDPQATADAVKAAILSMLGELRKLSVDDLLAQRRRRLASYGVFRQT
jgi:acetyl-CoA carboxylase carboxyl transferase subunit alpha